MLMVSAPISLVPRDIERPVTGPMTLAALGFLACAAVRVTGMDHLGMSFCYFKLLTGHACLTCGSTRAFGHLSHFDLPRAFAIQPLVTTAILGLFVWGLADAVLLLVGRRSRVSMEKPVLHRMTIVLVILAFLNWFYLLSIGA